MKSFGEKINEAKINYNDRLNLIENLMLIHNMYNEKIINDNLKKISIFKIFKKRRLKKIAMYKLNQESLERLKLMTYKELFDEYESIRNANI